MKALRHSAPTRERCACWQCRRDAGATPAVAERIPERIPDFKGDHFYSHTGEPVRPNGETS